MKQGRTLSELALELERQQNQKKDFIADTRELALNPYMAIEENPTDRFAMKVNGHGSFEVTDHTHGQIAQRLGIPQKYYDRMKQEQPELLKTNVEHWFNANPERRMVRTLDGRARAFLSDRYRVLDNYAMAEAVLPVLMEAGDIRIESSEITDKRLYIKAVFPKIEAEVAKGDVVQSGIVITNSEIGLSAVKVEPLVYRLVCLNGLIAADYGTRKYHVGRNADGGDAAHELYRDETLKADDKAFWMKIQDTVRGSLDQVNFGRIVESMRNSTYSEKLADPVKAVELVSEKYNFNRDQHNSVLKHLLSGGDLSKWGMVNAITAASQDMADYDVATDMERLGGNVLVLPNSDWREIAEAA